MTWVWENSRSQLTDRLVLLAIADQARDDGTDAWPSIARLAVKVGVSERTVQRSIRKLAELGELAITEGGGRHRPNTYRVVMETMTDCHGNGGELKPETVTDCHPNEAVNSDNEVTVSDPERVTSVQERVTNTTGKGDTVVTRNVLNHPEPSIKETPIAPSDHPGDDFDAFWATYPRRVGKPKALAAYTKATGRASPSVILDGARRYRDDPHREAAFTAHPTTWLNRDGWDDDPLPPRRDGPPGRRSTDDIVRGHLTLAQRLAAEEAEHDRMEITG